MISLIITWVIFFPLVASFFVTIGAFLIQFIHIFAKFFGKNKDTPWILKYENFSEIINYRVVESDPFYHYPAIAISYVYDYIFYYLPSIEFIPFIILSIVWTLIMTLFYYIMIYIIAKFFFPLLKSL